MKRIAIITGASGGIGKCFAESLCDHRSYDEVWLVARSRDKLESLCSSLPCKARPIPLDLTEKSACHSLSELIKKENALIGLLLNCSGYGKFESFDNISLEENLGMIDLNCRALTELCYFCIPHMDEGSEIINIASVAAFQPIPYIGVYGASKAYVLSFSRALSRELKGKGVRVLAVCPFWTKTGFFDRAVNENKNAIVKKYVVMYSPEYIVSYTWKSLKKKKKDYCIPGFKAKMQVFAVKILPHRLVMSIWQRQQKLR